MSTTFGPYSPIKKAGDYFFVSGQVGVDPKTKKAGETIEEQTEQVLENLKALVEAEGLSMANVVKTTIYLTDMGDFNAVNKIYPEFFYPPRPARAAVGVNELPRVAGGTKVLIEIEAVLYKESKQ